MCTYSTYMCVHTVHTCWGERVEQSQGKGREEDDKQYVKEEHGVEDEASVLVPLVLYQVVHQWMFQ